MSSHSQKVVRSIRMTDVSHESHFRSKYFMTSDVQKHENNGSEILVKLD